MLNINPKAFNGKLICFRCTCSPNDVHTSYMMTCHHIMVLGVTARDETKFYIGTALTVFGTAPCQILNPWAFNGKLICLNINP
jgi:hypothetical protein